MPDRHPAGERRRQPVDQFRVVEHHGAEHHPVHPALQQLLDVGFGPYTPAGLDRDVHRSGDGQHGGRLTGRPARAASRSTTCSQRAPASTKRRASVDRIAVLALPVEVALGQADGSAVPDVNRRIQVHHGAEASTARTKLARMPSPTEPDFSGWNWVPTPGPARRMPSPGLRSHRWTRCRRSARGRRSGRSTPRPGPARRPAGRRGRRPAVSEHVPLHLGVLDAVGQPPDRPGSTPSPGSAGDLVRSLVEQLEPDADPEERHAPVDGRPGRLLQAAGSRGPPRTGRRPRPRAARPRRPPPPGPDRRPGRHRPRGAGGPSRPSAGCRCRSRGPRSPGGLGDLPPGHSVPLVEGMPPPSRRTASRRARATPLNDASRM